jgi:hypothetical protein
LNLVLPESCKKSLGSLFNMKNYSSTVYSKVMYKLFIILTQFYVSLIEESGGKLDISAFVETLIIRAELDNYYSEEVRNHTIVYRYVGW